MTKAKTQASRVNAFQKTVAGRVGIVKKAQKTLEAALDAFYSEMFKIALHGRALAILAEEKEKEKERVVRMTRKRKRDGDEDGEETEEEDIKAPKKKAKSETDKRIDALCAENAEMKQMLKELLARK